MTSEYTRKAPKRATILDVAYRAGVSKSTVSLVLRNSPLVRKKTALRVRKAMSEVGYVYNRAAASLRSSSAGLIGLVVHDLRNPFFTEFAASAQMTLSRRNYATVLSNSDEDPELQMHAVSTMIEHGVAAFILSPTYGDDGGAFDLISGTGIPALQVLRKLEGNRAPFPFASFDYIEGGRLATRHLLEAGAKQIAFVGGPEGRPVTIERLSGYLEVLRSEGLPEFLLLGGTSRAFGREAAAQLAHEHPEIEAALCFNDFVALGMMARFAETGIRVGEEFRLAGVDGIEECAQAWPQLTSVNCDIARFGERAALSILDWLEEGVVPPAQYHAGVELIVRASTCPR